MDARLKALAKRLPAHPGLLGRERMVNSAVLICLKESPRGPQVLLNRRALGIRQEGEICFPGGRFDPAQDSDMAACALREAREELGLDTAGLTVLGRLDTLVAPMGAVVDSVVALWGGELADLRPDPKEVAEAFVLPLALFAPLPPEHHTWVEVQPTEPDGQGGRRLLLDADALGLPPRYRQSWGGRRQRVLVYPTPQGVVWGLTAELLHELAVRIEG